MNINIKTINTPEEMNHCFAIRHKVFVEGQKVPFHEEVDGKDVLCDQYLLEVDGQPVGTARVRFIDDFAKIERVAVLDAFQGKGLGKLIMEAILADLKTRDSISYAKLSAQTQAIRFYEQLGFTICSDEYMDCNIPHKDMVYPLLK